MLHAWYPDVVIACPVYVEVRRLAGHRTGRQRRVGRRREALRWRSHDAREDLVPDRVGPAIELAVPGYPLLLRAVDHGAGVELRIRDEAAAGEGRAGAVVHQGGKAVDVDSPKRCGLRDCPEFAEVTAAWRGHVDGQVRQRAPEVIERSAVPRTETLVVDVNRAVDHDVIRRQTQTCHAGVVADLEIEGMGRRAIGAWLKQEGVSLGAELIGDLLVGHGIDGGLDRTLRHAGIEDIDVRAKVRPPRRPNRASLSKRRRREGGGRRKGNQYANEGESRDESAHARFLLPVSDHAHRPTGFQPAKPRMPHALPVGPGRPQAAEEAG